MSPTALFRLYQLGASLALPFTARHVVAKLRRNGISTERAHERLGHATIDRPLGPLIWFHGASIGEAKSVLPLITHLHGKAQLLLTSGTATSAKVIEERLPKNTIHQFSPLDGRGPLTRFLEHWRPLVCVLIESELWPNMLDICARGEIPIALLNARTSEKSARRWEKVPATARFVFRGIQLVQCQDIRSRDHFRTLGLSHAETGPNLKSFVQPTRLDMSIIGRMRENLGERPVWVAASTQEGDEQVVLSAHRTLLSNHPDLCLILVPRNPDRARALRRKIGSMKLTIAQRSAGDPLDRSSQVYIADTVGETEYWFTLSPIVFVGGSMSNAGGHSPYEAAAAHSAIVHGPNYDNFSDIYETFLRNDASIQVMDDVTLAETVNKLLTHSNRAAQLGRNALKLTHKDTEALDDVAARILTLGGIRGEISHG